MDPPGAMAIALPRCTSRITGLWPLASPKPVPEPCQYDATNLDSIAGCGLWAGCCAGADLAVVFANWPASCALPITRVHRCSHPSGRHCLPIKHPLAVPTLERHSSFSPRPDVMLRLQARLRCCVTALLHRCTAAPSPTPSPLAAKHVLCCLCARCLPYRRTVASGLYRVCALPLMPAIRRATQGRCNIPVAKLVAT
jgi:hypothetical protein